MGRHVIFAFTAAALLVLCSIVNMASSGAPGEVSLELGPAAASYNLRDVPQGVVVFWATVVNGSDQEIILAHPSVCFPGDHQSGQVMHFSERHGQAELLLTAVRPDGKEVVLRDGWFFFEPDRVNHYVLGPQASCRFRLGWFFPNERGYWEDYSQAADLFMTKGEYRVSLVYRNSYPQASIHDTSTGKADFIPVWTGELSSNEVLVTVK